MIIKLVVQNDKILIKMTKFKSYLIDHKRSKLIHLVYTKLELTIHVGEKIRKNTT